MNKVMPLLSLRNFFDKSSRYINNTKTKTIITSKGKEVPKIKEYENRVTLIGTDNTASITNIVDAQNIALRRDLKLVKIEDVNSKTRRPIYKLMTNSQYHMEELNTRKEKQEEKAKSTIKGVKLHTISTKIGDHDLMTNINKMVKALQKKNEVRVVISMNSAESENKAEEIYSTIAKNTNKISKLVQKRTKGNSLKFQLLPNANITTSDNNNNDGVTKDKANITTSDNNNNDGVTKDKGPL